MLLMMLLCCCCWCIFFSPYVCQFFLLVVAVILHYCRCTWNYNGCSQISASLVMLLIDVVVFEVPCFLFSCCLSYMRIHRKEDQTCTVSVFLCLLDHDCFLFVCLFLLVCLLTYCCFFLPFFFFYFCICVHSSHD